MIKTVETPKNLLHERPIQHEVVDSIQNQNVTTVPSLEEHPSSSSISRTKLSPASNRSLDPTPSRRRLKDSYVEITSHIDLPKTKNIDEPTHCAKTANTKNEPIELDHLRSKVPIDMKKTRTASPIRKHIPAEIDHLIDNITSNDVSNKKLSRKIDRQNPTRTPTQKDDEWAPDEDFKPSKPQRILKSSPKKVSRTQPATYKLRKAIGQQCVKNDDGLWCRISDDRFVVFNATSEISMFSTPLDNIQTISVSSY